MWTSSAALSVTPETRQDLERIVRSGKTNSGLRCERGRFLAPQTANRTMRWPENSGQHVQRVLDWRQRFADGGIRALYDDRPRGRSFEPLSRAKEADIIVRTQTAPEQATQWSCSSMAKACGVSTASVQRVWHANGLKPHLLRTFKLSNDPDFIKKLEDVIGLYMNPPANT